MPETFLAILTAHLLGDFVFQTNWMAANKKKLLVLLLHVGIITVVSSILLRSLHSEILVVVCLSHLISDLIRTKVPDTTVPFVLDQLAHVVVAIALAGLFPDASANGWWPAMWQEWLPRFHATLCLISGLVLVVPAGGILIGKLTTPISKEIEASRIVVGAGQGSPPEHGDNGDYLVEGLKNGGLYIGWLERFLTLLLILIGQPTGIGFLIAAKSILRFGEIKDSKHRKVAEYIIIGTFLSFGWALLMSVLMQQGIEHWVPKKDPEPKPLKVILEPSPTAAASPGQPATIPPTQPTTILNTV